MATKDMHYSCQSPICVLQYCDINGYVYANSMTPPHATPRSTLPPADHHHQDIAALQDRLTGLSQASLHINESLDLDDVFRKVLDSARSLTGAHYGVITTINDAGHKNAFLSSGTTPEEHRRLAEMPERHQLFGYLSRLSSARFGPSRLRMRRIIRPQVVVPAIQSAPYAADSVATIAHLAFSLAGTILIPDCAPPKRLSPALFFPQLLFRRLLFTVAGVVGPDLPHGELPSLQLTTQPLLHRLGAQRYGAAGAGRGQPIQSGVGVRQAYRVPTHHTVVGVTSAGQPDPQADNHQQRVQPPMHGWFFQATQ